ncbi:hypothetical protein [Gordonia sp. WA4-43]|uniref:hypothetical protein n=1 Tax=Gordonia sp. WA4-43 TaxID=2878678 RepID=UPI001CFBDCE5|nr:hypothetical protein [Gordonia sp. WA4-43]UCZ89044.1 hypothetical protein LEL84_18595 [Gordonia sp. WA4-43]
MSDRPIELAYFAEWLASGERGTSSETIVSAVTGKPVGRYRNIDYPHDPADLRRCMQLLDAYPHARRVFKPAVRKLSYTWARMANRWEEMEDLLREEMATSTDGKAPRTYALMREIRGICLECDQHSTHCRCGGVS